MKIGILNCGHPPPGMVPDEDGYDRLFADLLEGQDFEFASWDVVDMDFPEGPDAADGWLITGSKHGAYDDLPFIPPLEELIRAIMAANRPLVGICFGHQIIAQAMGGEVRKWEHGWAVGHSEYDWAGETITLNAWHQDQVAKRPADAKLLATSTFCENAALLYGDKAFTVQAHPEFGERQVDCLVTTRAPGLVPPEKIERAKTLLKRPNDSHRLAEMIGHFFRHRSPQ